MNPNKSHITVNPRVSSLTIAQQIVELLVSFFNKALSEDKNAFLEATQIYNLYLIHTIYKLDSLSFSLAGC